jgi:hypothetical protein
MIAGNPKAGRILAAFMGALLLLIMVSTAIIVERKRTAPVKAIPLRPSVLLFGQPSTP